MDHHDNTDTSNEEIKYIIEIVKHLEELCLLNKVVKTIENKGKKLD